MKMYTSPRLNYVELRLEERISSACNGQCSQEEIDGYEAAGWIQPGQLVALIES